MPAGYAGERSREGIQVKKGNGRNLPRLFLSSLLLFPLLL